MATVSDPQQTQELILENEVRERLALDGAHVGLFEWDLERMESRWSSGFYKLHGLEPDGSASYALWKDCVHAEDIPRVEAEVQRAVAEGDGIHTEYRITLPVGQTRWVALQATTQRNAEDRVVLMTGYCGDVTRRKLADAALLESEKLAVAGRLSATIAHEINNPLEAVFNLLYLARGQAEGTEQAGLLDEAMEQLQRVSDITQQTLRFSRTTQAKRVKISSIIQATLGMLRAKLTLARVEVDFEVRGEAEILCSPGELQQVFTNILNNAVEATSDSGRVRIRLSKSWDWKTRARRGVRVSIGDTGAGMSPDALRRMSQAFFTTKEGSGTGLGMWVVRELLKKYQGELSVRTRAENSSHGTVFSLFFPAEH
jgi:PAS domain S-box-containing protein